MASIEDQIREVEAEIAKTQVNKATMHHLGKLKAKVARLRGEVEKRKASAGGGGRGYGVKKSGQATVGLVGFPSVGKSTLLNQLTGAESVVGAYAFTTLDVIPGVMEVNGAQIQVLDMPGLIEGASKGKGRGREVLAVARTCDLIVLMIDAFDPNIEVLVRELAGAGLRLNQKPANIVMGHKDKGGIKIHFTTPQEEVDEKMIADILAVYGQINGDIIIREPIDQDQFLDYLTGNRIYAPAIVALNKVDIAPPEMIALSYEKLAGWEVKEISAETGLNLEELKQDIYNGLSFMSVYLKKRGQKADLEEPLVMKKYSTVEDVCRSIHRDFVRNFRYAQVWGTSPRYPGQMVGLNHVLHHEDVLSIVVKRV